MPSQAAKSRATADARAGKSASTQAGEFVREEIDRVRQGEHGVRSAKQAIAIGLSEARRAGVKIPAKPGTRSTQPKPARKKSSESSATRSRASLAALKKESTEGVSPRALSRQAKQSAQARGESSRKSTAAKAVRTKGKTGLKSAAKKAGRTRQRPS